VSESGTSGRPTQRFIPTTGTTQPTRRALLRVWIALVSSRVDLLTGKQHLALGAGDRADHRLHQEHAGALIFMHLKDSSGTTGCVRDLVIFVASFCFTVSDVATRFRPATRWSTVRDRASQRKAARARMPE